MTKIKYLATIIVILAACFAAVCGAQDAEGVRFPEAVGFVNDHAGILSDTSETRINNILESVEQKTSAEVVVVTVKTTTPLTIEQYAVQLFQKWGIGKKGADNGLLLLVAAADRKVRIEVGYGLEGVVTDLKSGVIIRDVMLPEFKKGNYDLGIFAAVMTISQLIAKEYGVDIDLKGDALDGMPPHGRKGSTGRSLFTLLLFILIFGFRFGTFFFLMNSRSSYWSGGSRGSFGGGFGGFGGGFSGGGGASGSW
ncbi:MAG: TPM domain-containing protein [Candidatus Omnitrophota bacterium]